MSSSAGSYLPLSVYAQKGYNVEDIRKNCNDMMTHPVLGTVYRVAISSHEERSSESTRTLQQLCTKRKSTPSKRKRGRSVSSCKSGSLSTTSSGSSSSEKAKKGKKDKKDKKEKKDNKSSTKKKKEEDYARKQVAEEGRKAARLLEQAVKKAQDKLLKEARQAMVKTSAIAISLGNVTNHEQGKRLPQANLRAASQALKVLQSMESEAKAVLTMTKKDQKELSFSVEDVNVAVVNAKRELTLCETLLSALRSYDAH